MSNADDFVIENGVLEKYVGPGGNVVVPEGVTSIGSYAFGWCKSLQSITLPEGLTSMGSDAFYSCENLQSITLPEGVTSIGYQAFYGCEKLQNITLPEGVKTIGDEAFKGCKGLADGNGFVIVKDILFDYDGSGGNVVVPEGVTSIGKNAFSWCKSLQSITLQEGLTSIGDEAFQYCEKLQSITLPEGVTSIGKSAFSWCKSLQSITLPESVTSIGSYAFQCCEKLQSITLPEGVTSIEDSAFSCCENLQSITLPEGVTSIGKSAFSWCKSLQSITLPESVTSIGSYAFQCCEKLQSITLPEGVTSIGNEAFKGCSKLQWIKTPVLLCSQNTPGVGFVLLLTGEKSGYFAYTAKTDKDNISDFAKPGCWSEYDKELINNGPAYKYKLPARIIGALGRLLNPVELTEENRALFTELLNKNAKKLVPIAEQTGDINIIEGLLSLNILDDKTAKAVKKLLSASSLPALAALANTETMAAAKPTASKKSAKTKQETDQTEQSPLQKEFAAKFKAIKGDAVIKKMKLLGTAMPKLKLADGSDAPDELFRFLLVSYGSQMGQGYHFDPDADAAAKLLSYDSLCDAMDAVSGHLDGPNYPAILPLLCRYGNALQIRALTDAWKQWGNWHTYGQKGRTAQEVLSEALVLSDTRRAVVWLEKNASLKKYAEIRNITVDDVYESFLFDFGFDESGKRIFDLGVTTIEVTLTPSLTLTLYNTEKKKTARSIPKKGVDPAVQKKAADELADMKQNLKKAAKIKSNQLYNAYLDAAEFSVEKWKKSYLSNPFLRQIARLLVWEQAGRFFTLIGDDPVDSEKQPFTLSGEPIKVAHPMEMKQKEIKAWQQYFSSNDLKQLFLQVWEPACQKADFREDRYKDCRINPLYLKSKGNLGIECEWYVSHRLGIEGFDVEAQSAPYVDGDKTEHLLITSLLPKTWNRRASSVIAYLDRITIFGRIKKDDISVMNQMDRFTLAQITDFIAAAQEANAHNVLAALLEYKNNNFSDFDPMDEFALEW